jgi:Protein of unknown function (DUF3467)
MEKPKETSKQGIDYRRDPQDFVVEYSNNAVLESTNWDLKIIFGQTDQSLGENVIVQRTAITLPWPYAKILAYLLQANLAAREAEDGHIVIPKNIIGPPPAEIPPEQAAKLKHPKEGKEVIHKLWQEFLAANPEAKP